jgi:hypothetical protein
MFFDTEFVVQLIIAGIVLSGIICGVVIYNTKTGARDKASFKRAEREERRALKRRIKM